MMQKDKRLADCILKSSINIADGFPIFRAARLLGDPVPERITGIELMEELLKLAGENSFSVYFLGSKPEVLEKVIDRCAKEYPTIQIMGSHHGYYHSGEEHVLIDEIASKNPDILFLALGLPQKEYFVNDYGRKLNASVILPVGGGFDVYSGEKKRAPQWVQNMGIEWLWRSIYDRSRGKLIFNNFLPFIKIILEEMFKQRILRKKRV
jgi:N-acetylglucosaminyldiphosphoundecaprenol N-acetyl-beta-D-mannosaminyltransferase